ncbi:hydrogenase maturation protease [bacterium]|nr:hydrogenase maturation protease [bacterium]
MILQKQKTDDDIKTVYVGLGNTILSDDGVGIYVLREIGEKIDDSQVTIKEASVGGLELLDYITGFGRAVIIDAVRTGKYPPGTVVAIKADDLPGGSSLTRHQVPFSEALVLGRKIGMQLPSQILIFGIEAEDVTTFSEECTPVIAEKIPEIADKIISAVFMEE